MVRHFAIIIHEGTLLSRKGGQRRKDVGYGVMPLAKSARGTPLGRTREVVYNTRCVMPLAK